MDRRCQCPRWAEPCGTLMTQEDLRCDNCRDGCGLITFFLPDGWRLAIHGEAAFTGFAPGGMWRR